MIKVSNEELSKIAQFVASCDDMINGKFILADVKITKVLNMIANSEELYRYISECMVGFDFAREYHRAEVKNNLNGGTFAAPQEPEKLVSFVFCILVECDAKRLDFYNFINENFGKEGKSAAYNVFATTLLVPFKEIIANHFGLSAVSNDAIESMTENYREDLKQMPIFEDENNKTIIEDHIYSNTNEDYNVPADQTYAEDYNYQNESYMTTEHNYQSVPSGISEQQTFSAPSFAEQKQNNKDVWQEICDICENVESAVYAERHLKEYLKEELLYILKTVKYSTKYKDVKIISALVTAFDELTKKFRSIQFVFGELKNKIETLYWLKE